MKCQGGVIFVHAPDYSIVQEGEYDMHAAHSPVTETTQL